MKALKPYAIALAGLKNQTYEFEYSLGDDFFALFPHSPVQRGSVNAHLTLQKSETMLELNFTLHGTLQLVCDRSLEEFDYPITSTQKLFLQYADHEEELDDNLALILRDALSINVAEYLYEYIALEVPLKKLHPRFQAEANAEGDEDILVYSSSTDGKIEQPKTSQENDNAPTDPRWAALKNLKSDN